MKEENKNAIEIIKQMIADGQIAQNVAEKYFPELKESEDERIRESLLEYLHTLPNHYTHSGVCAPEWIAWIENQVEHANFRNKIQIGDKVTRNEDGVLVNLSQLNRVAKPADKQGEQKPTEWSEEDENRISRIIAIVRNSMSGKPDDISWLKSLKDRAQPKPRQEWSEEDEIYISDVLWCVEQARKVAKDENDMGTTWCAERWLKSIRPRNMWKPSDEQMIAIQEAINIIGILTITGSKLNSLYQDLKKLKE